MGSRARAAIARRPGVPGAAGFANLSTDRGGPWKGASIYVCIIHVGDTNGNRTVTYGGEGVTDGIELRSIHKSYERF